MASDPYWYYKVLGLHCDGTNGSTTFTDVGPSPKTVTPNGNAQISTAQYPALSGKTSSLYLDGSGDYLSIPDSGDWDFAGGDFTLRARVSFAGYSANNGGQYVSCIISQDGATSRAFAFNVNGTSSSFTSLSFAGFSDNSSGYTIVSASYSFALNTWYLLEACRVGNLVYLFVDGALLNSGGTAFSRTIQDSNQAIRVGAELYDATYLYYLNGYVSEVEIYKGFGAHTASYTPTTTPFADEYFYISGTTRDSSGSFASRLVRVYRRDTGALVGEALSNSTTGAYKVIAANSGTISPLKHYAVCYDQSVLDYYKVLGLHCDGTNGSTTFTDVKGNAVTANGNAQISTAQYPALTGKTSSAYFDGSGDYLSLSNNISMVGSDLTIEMFVRFTTAPTAASTAYILFSPSAAFDIPNFIIWQGALRFNLAATGIADSGVLSWTTGQWYHLSAVKIGNTYSIYRDGTLVASATNSRAVVSPTGNYTIGTNINGHISEVQVYVGIGIRTGAFTPPTDPFSSSATATENALIFDDITPA